MPAKKITNKAKIGVKVVRDEGIVRLAIHSLLYIEKKTKKKSTNQPIAMKVKYSDAVRAYDNNLTTKKKNHTKSKTDKLKIAWIMPPPGRGSGGHLNIFRFIKYLEDAGNECSIYLYSDSGEAPIDVIKNVMGDSYPNTAATMCWLDDKDLPSDIDAIFCTSWETAYAAKRLLSTAEKFYFVQDFEPYFYPVGGLYSLAENTYRFGFYGITAGGWLSKKLHKEYAMETDHYEFGADNSVYSHKNKSRRSEVLFYARPYTERRGFEVGVLALDIFHKMHPEIIINFVGWDVSNYDIPFPYKNLKTLEIDQLNGLYNNCVAGLVLSYTNMSLLPLELLSSGTIPVVNDGPNNRLVSNNKYIAYSENNPLALAKELSKIVSRKNSVDYGIEAASSVKINSWDTSGKKFVDIVRREVSKNE